MKNLIKNIFRHCFEGIKMIVLKRREECLRQDEIIRRFEFAMEKEKLFLKNPSEEHMSRVVGTNRTYLSHAIQKHYHRNYCYITNCYKVDYALQLMEQDPYLELDKVAAQSGFGSRSSFNRAFHSILDAAPHEYCRLGRIAKPGHRSRT